MELMILFPDQDSFYDRMGMEVYENYSQQVGNLYKIGKKKSDIDLARVLIYKNEEYIWDETSKMIAVLVTSVAYYYVWKELYREEPRYLTGYGLGYISALVCAGMISLKAAIRIIKNKKNSWIRIRNISDKVIAPSNGKALETKKDILQEIERCKKNHVDAGTYISYAEKLHIDGILEIGPGNLLSKSLCKYSGSILTGYLDISGDNNYILESFEYKKHFNRYYCILRFLGMFASTPNRNNNDEGYDENMIAAYNSVKSIVDASTIELFKSGEVNISDKDFNLCLDMLKVNFQYKLTPEDEISLRIKTLESETFIRIMDKFSDAAGPEKVR